ncbi:MAG: slipin family protein [Spirochaetaceae bacterium]|jgi:regulator of protease activity HflC (stomatin/prohibitin superfamily)|nr:slipin family protein [Spirochaetaceae bacterium]
MKDMLIKNKPRASKRSDWVLNTTGIGMVALSLMVVLALRISRGDTPTLGEWGVLAGIPVSALIGMLLFPRWVDAVKIFFLAVITGAVLGFPYYTLSALCAGIVVFVAPVLQKCDEWERAVVLRLGRFYRVRGPGVFFLIPLLDRIAQRIDMRIRVSDFSTQETLSLDSVTMQVDALCFWLVWDAEKAALEVENYEQAVILSSKTALRNAVSSTDLTTFLRDSRVIERKLQATVDEKTTEWGITIQHIEITDIQIPEGLQDSLARLAQAEREKKSRILLAEAEIDIANRLADAAAVYAHDMNALKLKTLSILNEGLKAGNSMMLVPNEITEELKDGSIFGLQALAELHKKE